MVKKKWKSLLWTVAAAILAVSVTFGALAIHSALNASAEETVSSTMTAGGVVTANELAYQHILIDGEGDADAVIIKGAAAKNALQISSNGTLYGWKQTAINGLPTKVILEIPNTVTSIAAADTENPTDLNGINTVAFTGLGIDQGSGSTGGSVPTKERTVETLVGVVFEAGTKITTIGEGAFRDCNNLRACVLPSSVTEIGKEAFKRCAALRDIVIPESVTDIKANAFGEDGNLYHVSLPSGVNVDKTAFDKCYSLVDIEYGGESLPDLTGLDKVMNVYKAPTVGNAASYQNKSYLHYTDDPVNRFVFSYNKDTSGTLATISASDKVPYSQGWYFIGFAGNEAKAPFASPYVTYELPNEFSLTAARTRVKYDFLNCKGEKVINTFTDDTTVNRYDINTSACMNTYFSSIIIPDAVHTIGDYAFFTSHVMRADIGKNVSAIGAHAFRGVSSAGDGSPRRSNNIYYIRNTGETEIRVGQGAFAVSPSWTGRPDVNTNASQGSFNQDGRTFIFANSLMFDKETGGSSTLSRNSKYNKAGDTNVKATFLVPVNMVEYDPATKSETVSKYQDRLYGQTYRTLPQRAVDGTYGDWLWTPRTPSSVPLPKLEGYTETVWYSDNQFTQEVTLDNIDTLRPTYTKGTLAEIKLYTKKLGNPNIADQTYTYGELTGNGAYLDNALKLAADGDFTAEWVRFDSDKIAAPSDHTHITDAGVYTLRLQPKSKWGTWTAGTLEEDRAKGRIVTVTVNAKPIDMGAIANIVTWNVKDGNPLGGGSGEGVVLYQYDDGWYLSAQGGKSPLVTTSALSNAYVRLTGDDITVQPVLPASAGEASAPVFVVNSTVGNVRSKDLGTGVQQATTQLEIRNYNYVFSDESVDKNRDELSKYGTSITVPAGMGITATINKTWYVVTVGNWLMPAPDDKNPAPNPDDPFHLVTLPDNSATTVWDYDSNITVHIPQAANKATGGSQVFFTLTDETNDRVIKKAGSADEKYSVDELKKFINSAMPAGTYSVRFTAEGGTGSDGAQYPGIDETVRLTVNRAALNTADIEKKLTQKEFSVACTDERNPVLANVFLYPEDTIKTELTVLNAKLDLKRASGDGNVTAADSVWSASEYDGYYGTKDAAAQITYNLDSMMTNSYLTLAGLNEQREDSRVPKRVGQYRVYYSVSAPNYAPLGGQTTGDAERRTYYFDTTIYLQLSLADPLTRISSYTMEYTGRQARPTVTYSPYFSYAFPDADYVNARNGCKVTLTVAEENKDLYRWNESTVPADLKSRVTVNDNVVTILFDITSAQNGWTTTPQLSGWTYGNFDPSVYRINALPQRGGTMYFRLGKLVDGSYEWVDLSAAGNECHTITYTDDSGRTVTLDNLFRLSEDEQKQGQVTDKIAEILKGLPQGEYYLDSYIDGIESSTEGLFNVKPFNTSTAQYARVIIAKTVNRWTQSPKIVSWTWDNYSDARNVISATALHVEGSRIVFSILNSEKKLISPALTTFSLTDGKVSASVSQALRGLDAGTYYLLASLAGTDSFDGLNEIPSDLTLFGPDGLTEDAKNYVFDSEKGFDPISFEIAILTGRFDQTPAVIDWTYGTFSQSTNFVEAAASYGANYGAKQEISVWYALSKSGVQAWTDKTYAEAAQLLNDLSAGDYSLYVYTVHDFIDKNFTKAESTISFNVNKLTNTWTTPALSGWTYGSPRTLANPNPAQGTATYTLNGTGYSLTDLNTELATLGASDSEYTLVVAVAEDAEKYTGLSETIKFRVSRDSYGWTAEPSVGSFTWDNGTTKVTATNGTLNAKWNSANDSKIERNYYKTIWNPNTLSYERDGAALSAAPVDAGTYVYVTHIPASVDTNYNELTHSAFFEIRQAGNQWTGNGTSGGQITNKNVPFEWHKATFTFFGAQYGSVSYTVGGNSYTADTLLAGLNTLSAGTHSLVCTVTETPNYAGLTDTLTVNITKAQNDWTATGKLNVAENFDWGTKDSGDLNWNMPKPEVGDVVAITVSLASGTSLFYMELHVNGTSEALETEVQNLLGRLMALSVGNYKISAVVAETDNCKGCSAEKTFTVNKAKNDWKANGKPSLSATEWVYNTSAGTPSAEAEHGNVTYTYYAKAADGTRTRLGNTMPANAGSYSVGFSVSAGANDNYGSVAETFIDFTIRKAQNEGFSTNPYAIGWTWNTFDKTVNLFGAVPATGGSVSFSVKKDGKVVNGLSGIRINAQNVIVDPDGSIAEKLNALDAGNYELVVSVGEVANYVGFDSSAVFSVAKAPNRWTTNPNIARWSEYYFKADKNTPQAVPQYGKAVLEVRGQTDGRLYYKSVGGVAEVEDLNIAMGGWYTFTAVVADHKNYAPLNYSIEFQIFTESVDMPNNYWVTVPYIESWIAGSTASEPVCEALRGTEILTYSKAELVNGKYVAVGTPSAELPEAPGKYFMHARISQPNYPQDEKLKLDVMFEIFERANEWTVAPSIQSWSLGDGPSTPVADVLYKEDCVIDIKYKLKYSDDEPTAVMPNTPGTYLMIVRATAKYCAPLEAEIEFTVSLSQNSWLSAPVIKDWSEEFEASNPFGEAAVGNEHIVYTYARADKPEERFTEKPTTEGDYILYATLAMDGYETLTAEYAFTISPAYDSSLLTLDIVLGVIACLATCAVIFIAIKRYKQN